MGGQEMFCANKRKKRPYSICPDLLPLVCGFVIETSYLGDAFKYDAVEGAASNAGESKAASEYPPNPGLIYRRCDVAWLGRLNAGLSYPQVRAWIDLLISSSANHK